MNKLFFLLLYIICWGAYVHAQEPISINLVNQSEVPDIRFYDILEDKRGFIWLAGDKGLFRYDGKKFKKFDNKNKKGLAVFDLNEDTDGKIWCTNIAGQILYAKNDSLYTHSNIGSKINYQLPDIFVYKNNLFVFSIHEIFKIDKKTGKSTSIFKSKDRIGMGEKKDGNLIFNSGVNIYKIKDGDINTVITHSVLQKDPKNEGRGAIIKPYKDYTIVFKYNGEYELYKLKDQNIVKIVLPEELKKTRIINVYPINNQLWLCTNKGLFIYEITDNNIQCKHHYLKDVFITDMLIDSNENYWFSTIGKGLYVMPNINVKKLPIKSEYKNITAISKINENTFVFGTLNGYLIYYDIRKKICKKLLYRKNKKVNLISTRFNDKYILVGFDDTTLKVNLNDNSYIEANELIGLKSISKTHNNQLVAGTYASAKTIDISSLKSTKYLEKKRTKTTYFDSITNTTYVGFIDKLKRYNSTFEAKEITYKKQPILSTAMNKTNNGVVWTGTTKNGLFGIKNDSIFYNLTTKDGLLSNTIVDCKSDKNFLWIITEGGIQKINTTTNKIQTLTQSEGIPPFNISGLETSLNDIILSTNKGLYLFNKNAFKKYRTPNLYITNVALQNKATTVKSSYLLPYTNNHISFSFFSNGFKSDENIIYQYQLSSKKSKSTWRQLPKGVSSLEFNSISSGNYTLKIQSKNTKSNVFSDEISINIKVETPLWKNIYFILFTSLLITLTTIFFVRRRIRLQQEKQELEFEKIDQEKQLISMNLENLRSQMNPHFIFNSLSTIQEYILTNETELASEFLVKFSRLIRMYLEHSQVEEITLEQEIETLRIYLSLEKERFNNNLTTQILIEDSLKNSKMLVPSIFIQPYVENALKHGLLHKKDNKKLTIKFTKEDNFIKCVIEDNGIGRKKAQEILNKRNKGHKSFATSANQKRLELINSNRMYNISVEIFDLYSKNKPTGTNIVINIPIKKHDEDNNY